MDDESKPLVAEDGEPLVNLVGCFSVFATEIVRRVAFANPKVSAAFMDILAMASVDAIKEIYAVNGIVVSDEEIMAATKESGRRLGVDVTTQGAAEA